MKIIIFKDNQYQSWLHLDKIKKIHTHEYSHYTKTVIFMFNDFCITISDVNKTDFNKLLYDFINSNKKLKIIKVESLFYESENVFFRMPDWVSEAMGER